jgi:RHS repeat-associated protein
VGNRVGLTDPDGGLHTYTYDSLNRGATYQKPTNQLYTQQYDADSWPTTLLMGLGTRELCQYDPVGRLTTLIQQKSDGTPILTVVDTYDPGRRKTVSTRDGVPATYSYDKASRLLGQDKAGQVATFSYDNTDNVLVKWHQGQAPISMSYDAANRLVTSVQGAATTTYTFDGVGNLTQEALGAGSSLYSYDGENRLTKYTAADLSVTTMTYEGEGLRRSRQVQGSVPTTFVWDGSDYLQEKSGSSTSALYSVFNGRVVSEARSGTNLDYVRDTLGSTAALANASQALSDTWQYWPYGEIFSHVGSSNTPLTWVGTLGYYQDLLNLMYYIRARIERPDLARWLTVDPLWPDEPSYAYAFQAPTYLTDPSGKLAAVGTPCTDLLKPGDLDENARDLVNCLSKATDRASIQKCLDKFGKGLDDKAKDALRAFIACTIASRLARGNCVPLCPGCDPCKSGLEAPDNQWCCYEKFLNCLMKCYGKGGIDLGLCITKCNYSKNGFIDCGFANAL